MRGVFALVCLLQAALASEVTTVSGAGLQRRLEEEGSGESVTPAPTPAPTLAPTPAPTPAGATFPETFQISLQCSACQQALAGVSSEPFVTALIDGLNNLAGASVTPIVTITETNSVRLTLSTSADQSAVIAAVDSQVCVGTATCTVTEASSGRRRALSSTVTLEVMRTIVYDPATASTTMIVVGDEVAAAAQTVDATASTRRCNCKPGCKRRPPG